MDAYRSLDAVAAGIDACTRCPLYKNATQGVPGEGPRAAKLFLVGEQPGDKEDVVGKPFVGPAGAVLDAAMAEAASIEATLLSPIRSSISNSSSAARGGCTSAPTSPRSTSAVDGSISKRRW